MTAPPAVVSLPAPLRLALDIGDLVKARLSTLVLVTVAVGFQLASGPIFDWPLFWTALAGALLGAFGANALNQWWELRWDGAMERTRDRPLPSGRMTPGFALAVAVFMLAAGAGLLAWRCHPGAAAITVGIALAYVLVYTPLKRVTAWSLIPGAIVGAAPPLIGWLACRGRLDAGAWALFGIVFAWQIPHFLAIDWVHRDDYGRAGYRMVSGADPSGRLTGWLATAGNVALVAVSLLPWLLDLAGPVYAAGAVALGLGMLALCVRLLRRRTRLAARRLFLASLAYLPLLFALLILEPL